MTARTELCETGQLGVLGAEALYRSVLVTALAHNFPPPAGIDHWGEAVTCLREAQQRDDIAQNRGAWAGSIQLRNGWRPVIHRHGDGR